MASWLTRLACLVLVVALSGASAAAAACAAACLPASHGAHAAAVTAPPAVSTRAAGHDHHGSAAARAHPHTLAAAAVALGPWALTAGGATGHACCLDPQQMPAQSIAAVQGADGRLSPALSRSSLPLPQLMSARLTLTASPPARFRSMARMALVLRI